MRAYWFRSTRARELALTDSSGCSFQTGRWVRVGRVPSVMSSLIFFYHSFPSVIGDTETQSFDFSFSPPCLRVSSEAGGEIFIFFYIVEVWRGALATLSSTVLLCAG